MSQNTIKRFAGDNYPITVVLKVNGASINLSNTVVKMTINFKTPLIITGSVEDEANGKVVFSFGVNDLKNVGKFSYDIQSEVDGIKTTFVKDYMELSKDYTP